MCVYIYPKVHIWSSSNQNIRTPSILVVNALLKAIELWHGGEGGARPVELWMQLMQSPKAPE